MKKSNKKIIETYRNKERQKHIHFKTKIMEGNIVIKQVPNNCFDMAFVFAFKDIKIFLGNPSRTARAIGGVNSLKDKLRFLKDMEDFAFWRSLVISEDQLYSFWMIWMRFGNIDRYCFDAKSLKGSSWDLKRSKIARARTEPSPLRMRVLMTPII